MAKWSIEEKALLSQLRPTLSNREIEEVFQILGHERSTEAISKQSRKLGVKFLDLGLPPESNLSAKAWNTVLMVTQRREFVLSQIKPPVIPSAYQKSVVTKLKTVSADNMLKDLEEIRSQVPRVGSLSLEVSKSDNHTLCIMLSDTHVGRILENQEDGNEYYNVTIATERIRATAKNLVRQMTQEQISKVDEVVLFLGGDMVDGEGIFHHQEMELETHAAAQVLEATKAIWYLINQLADIFGNVRVVTTRGNHGRAGISPESNWDTIIYQQLELLIDLETSATGIGGLSIKNRYGEFNLANIRGYKFMLRHKAPVQADTASGIAKFAGWHGIHGWDAFIFGHFHHWGVMTWNGKPIFRNGSLAGGDDYAESLSYYDHPTQLAWITTNENVCAQIIPIGYK